MKVEYLSLVEPIVNEIIDAKYGCHKFTINFEINSLEVRIGLLDSDVFLPK